MQVNFEGIGQDGVSTSGSLDSKGSHCTLRIKDQAGNLFTLAIRDREEVDLMIRHLEAGKRTAWPKPKITAADFRESETMFGKVENSWALQRTIGREKHTVAISLVVRDSDGDSVCHRYLLDSPEAARKLVEEIEQEARGLWPNFEPTAPILLYSRTRGGWVIVGGNP